MNGNRAEQLLAEILRWIRPAVFPRLNETFKEEFFKSDGSLDLVKATVYSLTDGRNKATDIAKRARTSQPSVSRLWARWRQIGLAEPLESRQTRACFALETFGISVPGLEKSEEEGNAGKQTDAD